MKIEIDENNWSVDFVTKNKNKIFVLDNNSNKHLIKLDNVMFIRLNSKYMLEDVLSIKKELINGKILVFSKKGYGFNLKKNELTTFNYLTQLLKDHFNYNNINGGRWYKVPGHNEISNARVFNLDKNSEVLQPINNSFYRKECLNSGLYTTYDLIKNFKKVAFTSDKKYKNGDVLIFDYFKEKIVSRVIDSYDCSDIDDSSWSIFEGFDESFIRSTKKVGHQTHFQFICTLGENGEMIFNDDIFENKNVVEEKVETIVEKKESEMNEDVMELLNKIEKRLSKLEKKLEKKKKIFSKRSIDDVIRDNIDDVIEIEKVKKYYKVKTKSNEEGFKYKYYVVDVKSTLFFEKFKIIFSYDN